MKKIISGLIIALIVALAGPAAPASAAKVECGNTQYSYDMVFVGNTTVTTIVYYLICNDGPKGKRWIQNLSMTGKYDFKGKKMVCTPTMNPFRGVKWNINFRDRKGNHFNEKFSIPCQTDTTGKKFVTLAGSERLYYTGGERGIPEWEGTVTEMWGWGVPDIHMGTGSKYKFKN